MTPEHDEPAPEPDDLDLGYVDGTKLTLPSKFVKVINILVDNVYVIKCTPERNLISLKLIELFIVF